MNAASLLHLLQFASPALPVGGYSYSQGLEAALEAGVVGRLSVALTVEDAVARADRAATNPRGTRADG